LFLDGRNDLYLAVLRLLEPHLAPGALIAADLNTEDPDLLPYLEYIRDPDHGYQSIEIPLGDGVELSTRTGPTPRHRKL
jgi:predicted O-methyltransferase YrrM